MITKDEVKEIVLETLQEIEEEGEENKYVTLEWGGAIELMKDCLIVLFFIICAIAYAIINYTNLPLNFITDKGGVSAGLSFGICVSALIFINRRYGWL